MSESKDKQIETEQDRWQKQGEIVTDLFMRVAAMERILVTKNVISENDIVKALEGLSAELMEAIKSKLDSNGVK